MGRGRPVGGFARGVGPPGPERPAMDSARCMPFVVGGGAPEVPKEGSLGLDCGGGGARVESRSSSSKNLLPPGLEEYGFLSRSIGLEVDGGFVSSIADSLGMLEYGFLSRSKLEDVPGWISGAMFGRCPPEGAGV